MIYPASVSVGDRRYVPQAIPTQPGGLYRVLPDPLTTHQFTAEEVYANGVRLMRTADQQGAPAVFRTGTFEDHKSFTRTRFTREYQFMAADLLAMRKYGLPYLQLSSIPKADIVRAFNSLYTSTTAFDNFKGVDNCNNYLTGQVGRGEDPRIDPLICAGAIVEVLQVATNSKGIVMARLNSFRSPSVASLTDTRVLRATNIDKSDGHVFNFDQLKDGGIVPYPYISSQDCWYPLIDLAPLA